MIKILSRGEWYSYVTIFFMDLHRWLWSLSSNRILAFSDWLSTCIITQRTPCFVILTIFAWSGMSQENDEYFLTKSSVRSSKWIHHDSMQSFQQDQNTIIKTFTWMRIYYQSIPVSSISCHASRRFIVSVRAISSTARPWILLFCDLKLISGYVPFHHNCLQLTVLIYPPQRNLTEFTVPFKTRSWSTRLNSPVTMRPFKLFANDTFRGESSHYSLTPIVCAAEY